jgi:hypothetical protein
MASRKVFEEIGGYAPRQFTLTGTADPERVDSIVATSSFFRVLGAQPIRLRRRLLCPQPEQLSNAYASHNCGNRRRGPRRADRARPAPGSPAG